MPKIVTKIELNEKDLLAILVDKYNLKAEGAKISVYHFEGGDAREPSYTKITVEGEQVSQ